jgi:hypothetical protein
MLINGRRIKNDTQRCVLTAVRFFFLLERLLLVVFSLVSSRYITGKPIHVTKNEQARVMIMVLVITLK